MTNHTKTLLSFEDARCFSKRDTDYAGKHTSFKDFINFPPTQEGLKSALDFRSEYPVDREILCSVLHDQYQNFEDTRLQLNAIENLRQSDTFTIVTAHQPCLFLGPLYTVYKTVSAIKLAKQLSYTSGKTIIPIFVVGGEDHDFEEVNHTYLFNKKLTWQNNDIGPVGRMATESLTKLVAELDEILGNHPAKAQVHDILKGYDKSKSFSESTRVVLHRLFKDEGLLVLSMDDDRLKRIFIPEMEKELKQRPSKGLVETAQNALEKIGYRSQAFPREINLFYINDSGRNRIVFENEQYLILNTEIQFSGSELIAELNAFPERFSPNVVMRPIYQEKILPNLAYVGGGGELAYWLERKSQFREFNCFFPALIRRDSFMMIDTKTDEKITELDLRLLDFFGDENQLIQEFIDAVIPESFELTTEKEILAKFYSELLTRIEGLDGSLAKSAAAEKSKALKGLEHLETKLNRLYKERQSTSIKRIQKIKSGLFPSGKLQERHDNFIQYYLKYGKEWIDLLLKNADPLDTRLKVLHLTK